MPVGEAPIWSNPTTWWREEHVFKAEHDGRAAESVEEYVTTGDASVLKRKMEAALMHVLRSVKWDMFSLGPIIGYLMGREAEAKALRVIFGAKRGGFDYELPELYA